MVAAAAAQALAHVTVKTRPSAPWPPPPPQPPPLPTGPCSASKSWLVTNLGYKAAGGIEKEKRASIHWQESFLMPSSPS